VAARPVLNTAETWGTFLGRCRDHGKQLLDDEAAGQSLAAAAMTSMEYYDFAYSKDGKRDIGFINGGIPRQVSADAVGQILQKLVMKKNEKGEWEPRFADPADLTDALIGLYVTDARDAEKTKPQRIILTSIFPSKFSRSLLQSKTGYSNAHVCSVIGQLTAQACYIDDDDQEPLNAEEIIAKAYDVASKSDTINDNVVIDMGDD
jgi:hypothetical protein